jgi:hypothetical protein
MAEHGTAGFSTLGRAMASIDSLPADQRAVLQLVLQRGRSYDDIARLLSIDRAAVRQRALNALDTLGPQTRVAPEQRALITDWLLGQLPPRLAESTADRLAGSAAERAWARVLASELAPLATARELPELPSEGPAQPAAPEPAEPEEPARPARAARPVAAAEPATVDGDRDNETPRIPQDLGLPKPGTEPRPSSRRGGAILLALGLLVAIVIVVIVLATSGASSKHSSTTVASTPATATGTNPAASTTPVPVAQINLTSPDPRSKAAGIAQVVREGTATGIVIAAANIPPNTRSDAYAVWLYKPPNAARLLGFVNPGVGASGKLSTAGALPADAANYNQLLITLETQATPRQPGKIVLQGALSLG